MDTNKLKRFAIEARNTLKRGVAAKLQSLGFDANGHFDESEMPILIQGGAIFRGQQQTEAFYHQWMSLYNRIKEKGVKEVYEEAAYTWFNRFIAIRILQKNGLAEPVLDFVDVARTPHIVDAARMGHLPQMSAQDESRLRELLSDVTAVTEQFALLVTAYCHQTPILYKCFGSVADYTELLLPNDILAEGGFLDQLNHTPFITDEDYHSTELLGWLYQFYISERKDEVFGKKGKFEADEIPAATQIFTPNWIVKYMVQNTIGRIYLDNNPGATSTFKPKWKYLVEPSEPTPKEAICKYDELTDLKVGDLACGSGHILIESFDLMYDLYIHEGYTRKEAIENIFNSNLTGIDLDTRAKQLAQFALLLKACQKDNSFDDAHVMPHVLNMPEPQKNEEALTAKLHKFFKGNESRQDMTALLNAFKLMLDADSLGSIMIFDIPECTRSNIKSAVEYYESQQYDEKEFTEIIPAMKLILALTKKYHALVMNPPYMGAGNMNDLLSSYVKRYYEEGKADLMTVFMIKAMRNTVQSGLWSMINYQSWMFLSSFEGLRKSILTKNQIEILTHLGRGIFGSDFGTVSFVIRVIKPFRKGIYRRLFKKHVNVRTVEVIRNLFLSETGIFYSSQIEFLKIPGNPIGYWISENIINSFARSLIGDFAISNGQNITGDNDRFIRNHWEVSSNQVRKGCKWPLLTMGGDFRRWYGNIVNVIDWSEEARNFYKENKISRIQDSSLWFKGGITWNLVSASNGFRVQPSNALFNKAAPTILFSETDAKYRNNCLGFLNSKIAHEFLILLNPTVNTNIKEVMSLPYERKLNPIIDNLVEDCIQIAHLDWDAHETSWDFNINELVAINEDNFLDIIDDYADFHGICIDPAAPEPESLEWRMNMYEMKWETNFYRLKQNEEKLNRQFIEIYGLQDELEEFVPTSEITILQQGEITITPAPGDDSGYGDTFIWNRDVIIKQLISYAVGCWMGRYRLDKPGLHIAHPNPTDEEVCTYNYGDSQLTIDDDGIIPILPAECGFDDNLMKRVQEFIRIAFGREQVNQNISFVEACLGTTIEKYLIKDFWKDHKKMYQNRPIYWLFSSKKGAFQCLVYMHRMNANTADRVRCNYLMPHMDWLRQQIAGYTANAVALNTAERNRLKKLRSDLEECEEYNDRLQLVADHRIAFDLDDGVVVNYAKFGDVLAKIK